MRSILGRLTASCALLGLGGILLAYAGMSLQFNRNDPAPDAGRLPAFLHPEAWAQEGHRRYYVDLDADAASGLYRGAVLSNPLLIRAWLGLAEIEMVAGRETEGRRILETLAPFLDRVSTWKWQELLLAFEVRDEAYFERCFNFVLHRLPHRAREACYLAGSLWNGWAGTLPHVQEENQAVFLGELMRAREVETALDLWSVMVIRPGAVTQDLRLRFSEFLLNQKRLREAKEVWGDYLGGQAFGVFDGGFEGQPLGQSFGWRWARQADVAVERSREAPHEGSTCLHLRFKGTRNVAFHHVHQIVPVDGGGDYILSFARRSRNLTTDQGVALEVTGYACKGLIQRSEPALGSSPWTKEELPFSAPEGCEAAVIRIVRKESLKFDSKISGDYWLDGLSLKRVH